MLLPRELIARCARSFPDKLAYVCGDASRMAKDVDAALHEVIARAGGKTAEQAVEYVKQLKAQKRYQRDVY